MASTIHPRISAETYVEFERQYYDARKWPNQRLGQAFLNTHFPTIIDPDLFYQTNVHLARQRIYAEYVENGYVDEHAQSPCMLCAQNIDHGNCAST
jgi:hypothetical protein